MDSRFIFLYPYICDVVTEKASRTGYWIPGEAGYPMDWQIRPSLRGSREGANEAIQVVKSVMPVL